MDITYRMLAELALSDRLRAAEQQRLVRSVPRAPRATRLSPARTAARVLARRRTGRTADAAA